MKYTALAVVMGTSGVVNAQLTGGQFAGIAGGINTLRAKGMLKITQLIPNGKLPFNEIVRQPLPAPADNPRQLEIVRYGVIGGQGSSIVITGGAEIVTHGYRCMAENVSGDKESEIYTFSGDVRIIGKDEVIVGDSVTVNFRTKSFFATYGKTQIRPARLQNQVTGDIFISGKEAYGNSRKVFGTESQFTTCDKETPHFYFDAERSTVEPNKEAILRHVKINVLGHDILTLPVLWIPLGDRGYKNLPQFGQSPDEGYYIKNTFGFPMRGEDRGAIRTDYMSKLGFGLGMNYYYRNADMNGIAKVYGIFGKANTVSISNQHEQRFKWGTLTIDNDIQRNNYLSAPGASIINTRAQLRLPKFTTFNFSEQKQNSSTFSSYNQSVTMNDSRMWGKTSSNLDVTWNRSGSVSNTLSSETYTFPASPSQALTTLNNSRATVDVRYTGSQDVKQGVVSLEYQRTIPIGEVSNFFPSSDKTPVLSFKTDSTRLFGPDTFKAMPFRTEFSLGEYFDPIVKERFSRGMLDFNFNRGIRDQGNWRWDVNGGIRQTMYSDDAAMYRLTIGQGLTYAIGKKLSMNLRYSYLRPFGYSPLAIDKSGQTNTATADCSYQVNSKSSFGIQTGYDFLRGDTGEVAWQQVGIRSEYKLGNAFSFRTLTSYDTFNQVWSNVRIDTTWQTPTFMASIGARYDGMNHNWSQINAYMDGLQFGKSRLGTTLNFNGYTGRLDSQQYNLVYDLHCAEAILTFSDYGTGFRPGREIGFFIRLKAVPFDSNFGMGRLGQALGIGSGGRSF